MSDLNSNGLFELEGRAALVTGAGSGIGRAIAIGLARHGADVAGADINEIGLERTIGEITAQGRKGLAVQTDVTSIGDVTDLVESTYKSFGRLDILVNNAGVASHALPEELPLDEWHNVIEINTTGYFLCAQAAGRYMMNQETGGSIVNISSIAGSRALGRGNLVLSVSKGAVNQLTRELAVEWAKHNIRVNAILPCQVRTPNLQELIDDPRYESQALVERFLQGIPLNRLGEPEDLVGPVVFLCSDAAAMVTGVLLPVDGGNLALNAGGSHIW